VPDLLDYLLHVDQHLREFVQSYGGWVYGLLFGIIFAETGFVVTPFLPGDSLLFAAGTLCATGSLSTPIVIGLLALAAFSGNTVNYAIGRTVGPRIFTATDRSGLSHKLLNRDHLARAHAFFEQYGGNAVILGRFVPIVRTFVPFVAGAARMSPTRFVLYNVVGAAGWVGLCVGAGRLFGGLPFVNEHFSLITIGIVVVSVLPMVIEYLRHRSRAARPR
jgi:membrane-associated protein